MRPTLIAVLFIVASAEEDAVTSGEVPDSAPGAHFFEPFQADWQANWKVSKDADFSGRWNLEEYQGTGIPGDKGLVVSDPAKKHAVSTLFAEPVVPETAGLVVQYELQLKKGLTCGGAYLKLLTASEELSHDGCAGRIAEREPHRRRLYRPLRARSLDGLATHATNRVRCPPAPSSPHPSRAPLRAQLQGGHAVHDHVWPGQVRRYEQGALHPSP